MLLFAVLFVAPVLEAFLSVSSNGLDGDDRDGDDVDKFGQLEVSPRPGFTCRSGVSAKPTSCPNPGPAGNKQCQCMPRYTVVVGVPLPLLPPVLLLEFLLLPPILELALLLLLLFKSLRFFLFDPVKVGAVAAKATEGGAAAAASRTVPGNP